MASAGTVTVDFAAETAKFQSELKKVRKDLGDLKKDTASVSASLASFGNSVKGIVGFAAAATAIRAVVRATAEAEQAQALLNNALAASTTNVKAASADFQAYATQLQRTTTFGDEAVMQVETLLLAFQGLSGETVKRATSAVLDLSTRMGIDAPAAAKLLGKALADPEKGITALARAGVGFSDSQRSVIEGMIATGDAAGAQGLILTELEKRFGGAAAAARDTLGGAITGLGNAFDDLLEGKGGGINGANEAINNLADTLNSDEVKTGFNLIINALARIAGLTADVVAGVPGITKFIAESFAAALVGPAADDIVRTADAIENLDKAIARERGKLNIFGNKDEVVAGLEARRAVLQRQYDDAVKAAEALARVGAAQGKALGGKNAATDFNTGGQPIQADGDAPGKDAKTGLGALPDAQRKFLDQVNARLLETRAASDEVIAGGETAMDQLGELLLKGLTATSEKAGEEISAGLQRNMDEERRYKEMRVGLERDAQDELFQFRADGISAAESLLNSYHGKFKVVAKAAFLYEKANNIAGTAIATRKAVMETYAHLGYPWGIPAAIAVAGLGAAQIAAIAATNPGGSASVGGAGGGGGNVPIATPNNPIFNNTGGQQQDQGIQQQRVLQVHFNGDVYGVEKLKDYLGEILSEAFNEQDIVYISGNSRQAQEIRGT